MDAPLLQIGGKLDEKSTKLLAEFVRVVFTEGFKNHMDQETIRSALALSSALSVANTTVTGCVLTGEKSQ